MIQAVGSKVRLPRSAALAVMLVLVPLGLGSKRYHGQGQSWIHANAGDVLYAAFWLFAVKLIWPRLSARTAALAVFGCCTVIEFSQLLHSPLLDGWRRTTAGRLLLGSDFSVADIGCYGLGVTLAAILSRALETRVCGAGKQ